MSTRQGAVSLLREAVAQQLLQSKSPAHLAYTWHDGTPRVVPIGFHWNGQEIGIVKRSCRRRLLARRIGRGLNSV